MLYVDVERSLNSLLFLFSLHGLALPPSVLSHLPGLHLASTSHFQSSPGAGLLLHAPAARLLSSFCFPCTHTPPEPQLPKDGRVRL